MTKKIKLLVFSLFFMINTVLGQDCDEANYTFTTQEAIDQFGINYPDCKDITGSLKIDGTDIVNLNGLSQIQTIGWHLQIYNSSLTDLKGLDSLKAISLQLNISDNEELMSLSGIEKLESIGSLIIRENNNLSTLEGLDNVDFNNNTNNVIITDCPELEYCQLESLCEYLSNYGNYFIGNNAGNCKNRDFIISTCSIPPDTAQRVELFYDGFEEWDIFDVPLNWEGTQYFQDETSSIEMTDNLTEGDFSVLLRSIIPSLEGNANTTMETELNENTGLIDISFTYRCIGEGSCRINLGQNVTGSIGTNTRNIWNTIAGDTTQYEVYLPNIQVNPPFDNFKTVEIEASPVWTAVSSFGVSEFTIDDFLITQKSVNVSTAHTKHTNKVKIYPNPVLSDLYINSSKTFDRIVIFNHLGQFVKTYPFTSSINISELKPGIYYMAIEGGSNQTIHRRIVKI